MAALHSQQRGDLARLQRLFDAGGILAEDQIARIAGDQPLHHVDLLERRLDCLRLGQLGRDKDRPELRSDPALPQPFEVGLHRQLALGRIGGVRGVGEIEIAEHILATLAQLFGHVVVPVPHRRGAKCCLGDGLGRGGTLALGGTGDQGDGAGEQNGAVHETDPSQALQRIPAA
jgi:hypothetical protein